ncbi:MULTISPECIES: PAS domain-containing sensor histidine kinase [unclassified Fusibacter]|uniref:PAS domain-containing sensor histidine kinase n=1 Tax=unclassified Fusibacter TaxID=2624464 RepID=UPI0010100ED8|nr:MULTISPECIES: PAS domain-containing sensor histidine kinase [unclassified Fusibacter]MCK8060463.1 PAS domain-containing sensor histidine kinase [Fusibacter sp. A2]NPE20248.1 PAS domain-containing sensor histidine kinase [Fusibacter sp. A1]RXV63455.1 PAS domain-containing sensor histidine kinase [Fusibacter sp. A1]
MADVNLGVYRDVYNKMLQFIGILDCEGRMLDANENSLKFINCALEDVIGEYFWLTPWWAHSPDLQKNLKDAIEVAKNGTISRFEAYHMDETGKRLYVDFSITPVFNNIGTIEYLIPEGRDVSSIKLVSAALERSEKRYRDLFDKSPDASMIIRNGKIIECNDITIKTLLLGSKSELYEMHPSQISPQFQPDGKSSLEKANEMMATAFINGNHRFEWVHQRSDKTTFYVEVILTALEVDENRALYAVWRDISAFKKVEKDLKASEAKYKALSEDLEKIIAERTRALEGSMKALIATQNDLLESKKMASLGELVAGISHEINTPIGVSITGITFITRIIDELVTGYQTKSLTKARFDLLLEDLKSASDGVHRNLFNASNLIQSFKDVAVDRTNDQIRSFSLQKYTDEVISSLRNELKKHNCAVQVSIDPQLSIRTFPGALAHILTNLIVNSIIHGLSATTEPKITIEAAEDKGGIRIVYKDNGCGIDAFTAERIFDPFYTTKRGEGSSGLGMSIVYNLVVQKMHGLIKVIPHPDEGFHIEIRIKNITE